jgi:hypothetical protein
MRTRPFGVLLFATSAVALVMCGNSQVPLDQQERWKCNAAVLSSHVYTCHPCNNDSDCSGITNAPYTFCAEGRSLVPGSFGGCVAPVDSGTVRQGDCKMENVVLDTPMQIGGEMWTGTTCIAKNSSAAQADECCKKRCECIFNVCDHPGFVPPGDQIVCNTNAQDSSIAQATRVPDQQNPNVGQTCNGTEAGLQYECSPFKSLPEGQPKAQVRASLDSGSKVQISVNGNQSPLLTPSGSIHYFVEQCGSAQCALHITDFDFTVPTFSIKGETIDHVVVQSGREWTDGVVTMSTGDFQIPSSAMRVASNFSVGGKAGSITIHNGMKLIGNVDPTTQAIVLKGLVSQTEGSTTVDIDLFLFGVPTNRPPVAHAEPRGNIECNAPLGASVTLSATQSTDPDNNLFSEVWSLKGTGFIGYGMQVPFVLPYGSHDVVLHVNDKLFAESVDVNPVKVVDTTSPKLTAAVDLPCLWAPDHKMVLFQLGSSLSAKATDICDPTPVVNVHNVTSNQPPTGGGQGNTAPDVLFGAKAFCVRAERQGTNPFPRTYTVTVQAKDFAGNTTNTPVTIIVNHDQSGPKCPLVSNSRIVEDSDPRCTAN